MALSDQEWPHLSGVSIIFLGLFLAVFFVDVSGRSVTNGHFPPPPPEPHTKPNPNPENPNPNRRPV
jgi:Na+-transporting methylmalonyl-CoA/oxaloacetate decarboxylase gamma subunit